MTLPYVGGTAAATTGEMVDRPPEAPWSVVEDADTTQKRSDREDKQTSSTKLSERPQLEEAIAADTGVEFSEVRILDQIARRICSQGASETFRDGMESVFSQKLTWFINRFAAHAVDALEHLFVHERVNDQVISEGLRWIGLIEDILTRNERRNLLERCLHCKSALVRDGAGLGLAFIDDPRSLSAIDEAVKRENIGSIREGLVQVRDQLLRTRREQELQVVA
ncbi:MAG: hypothetical protein ACOC8E_01565 [Planctomycetota bacterium]